MCTPIKVGYIRIRCMPIFEPCRANFLWLLPIDQPFSDWSTNQSTNQQINQLTNQPTNQLNNQPTNGRTDAWTEWLTDWPTNQIIDKLTNGQTNWPNNWRINWLTDQLTDQPLTDWPTNLLIDRSTYQSFCLYELNMACQFIWLERLSQFYCLWVWITLGPAFYAYFQKVFNEEYQLNYVNVSSFHYTHDGQNESKKTE